jgi:hypothetical protein
VVTVEAGLKQLIFSWEAVPGTTYFRLMENPDGHSGFAQVGDNISSSTLSAVLPIAVHLQDWVGAQYLIEACNTAGCNSSAWVNAEHLMPETIGYFKASNAEDTGIDHWLSEFWTGDEFGHSIALSVGGNTLAVGAPLEDSDSTGVNGEQDNNFALDAGAVYVFRRVGGEWAQQAYVKASNAEGGDQADEYLQGDWFGSAVALSNDGNTLAVGARHESSGATGIDGNQYDNTAEFSGAVYVFRFTGAEWSQQAYIKASNAESGDQFGSAVSLSSDGNTLSVGAPFEDSAATGIDGDQDDNSAERSGAAYVFRFTGTAWLQQSYVKASDTEEHDGFGWSVALSADGNTLAVRGYVYRFDGASWAEIACVQEVASENCSRASSDLSADGNTLASMNRIFRVQNGEWVEQAVLRLSDPDVIMHAYSIAISADGSTAIVGDITAPEDQWWEIFGAVYVFRFDDGEWTQFTNSVIPDPGSQGESCGPPYDADYFGDPVALSGDGNTIGIGADGEDSDATGIGGNRDNDDGCDSGAVYLY